MTIMLMRSLKRFDAARVAEALGWAHAHHPGLQLILTAAPSFDPLQAVAQSMGVSTRRLTQPFYDPQHVEGARKLHWLLSPHVLLNGPLSLHGSFHALAAELGGLMAQSDPPVLLYMDLLMLEMAHCVLAGMPFESLGHFSIHLDELSMALLARTSLQGRPHTRLLKLNTTAQETFTRTPTLHLVRP